MIAMAVLFAAGGVVLALASGGRVGPLLCFVFAALSLGNFLWTPRTHVRLHDRGLVVREGKGDRVIEWDLIESLRSHLERRGGVLHEHHAIGLRGGEEIVLLRGIEELAD